jgi:hypothetical protein
VVWSKTIQERSLEQINPYAVTRNTATYEAYRAYCREMMKAGQGLVVLGTALPALWIPVGMLLLRRFGQPRVADFPLLLAIMLAPAVLSGLLVLIGCVNMQRYRREHPMPEEWRQVPRASWPPVAAQRPRLR